MQVIGGQVLVKVIAPCSCLEGLRLQEQCSGGSHRYQDMAAPFATKQHRPDGRYKGTMCNKVCKFAAAYLYLVLPLLTALVAKCVEFNASITSPAGKSNRSSCSLLHLLTYTWLGAKCTKKLEVGAKSPVRLAALYDTMCVPGGSILTPLNLGPTTKLCKQASKACSWQLAKSQSSQSRLT